MSREKLTERITIRTDDATRRLISAMAREAGRSDSAQVTHMVRLAAVVIERQGDSIARIRRLTKRR